MNKIPVKDLLNSPSKKNIREELQQINDKLFQLCSKLPSQNSFANSNVQEELRDVVYALTSFETDHNLTSEEKALIKVTYQLASMMTQILSDIRDRVKSGETSDGSLESEPKIKNNDRIFNILTQNMMLPNGKSYRGHRFSKENVRILEEWYVTHPDKPYLDKESTEMLMKSTQLTKVQIKNWVSNRRRKQRSVQVSPDILDLLQED